MSPSFSPPAASFRAAMAMRDGAVATHCNADKEVAHAHPGNASFDFDPFSVEATKRLGAPSSTLRS
jgi:hypothetical protein